MSSTATSADIDELSINTIRTLAMDAVQQAHSGHPGTPMGLAPLAYVLYGSVMRHNPANPHWPGRDRFVLSPGHACMLQYALLHLCGYDLPLSEIQRFRQWGSLCPGHPEFGRTPGVEVSTGPLGQGLANAVGFALAEAIMAERFNRTEHEVVDHRTYVVCSDGDMQEGIASEAASLAGNLGLHKLIAIYDDNAISIEGSTEMAFTEQVAGRFADYGWHIHSLHADVDLEGIALALREAQEVDDRPSLIVLRTHIAYGSPNKQDTAGAHGSPLGDDEVRATKEALGWPWPEETFVVPDAVRERFAAVRRRGEESEAQWSQRFEHYARENPELASELQRWEARIPARLPALEETPTLHPDDGPLATRTAGGRAINWLAAEVPELLGGAADLAPSTDTAIDGGGDILRHTFRARNLHFGIREHAMGGIVNGLTVSGLRPFGATFLVFSDYMRASVRMAALMEIGSIFVYTHDSLGVGEDGPTHQPIEQLAGLRAMPHLHVIRPADANETLQAWRCALERTDGPTVLALSRQKLPVLDPATVPADGVQRGAYVLRDGDDVALLATGSEVSLCLEAAEALAAAERSVQARVVSMPCWERFAAQPRDYRDAVLPPSIPARLSVEMAAPFGWARWVGDRGASLAVERFGASAPLADLLAHYGFTTDNVVARARALLDDGPGEA